MLAARQAADYPRGRVRRVVLSLLILAVLLPSTAFARIGFLCRGDGELRAACCCPELARQHAASPGSSSTLRASCCCQRLTAAAPSHAPATPEASPAPVPDPTAIIASTPRIAPVTGSVASSPRTTAPPDPERSLFARHCALLL
jgi:hypothetical protein